MLSPAMLDHLKNAVEFASHIPRYREIVGILHKYGFAEKLPMMALQRFLGMEVTAPPLQESGMLSKTVPERARLALEELGPTFVKFGQIVSSRRDLVTDDFYVEFSKLQSGVPPFPAHQARAIVAEELGEPVDRLFDAFEDRPIGSASIAQVHRARLLDGSPVAVKIQRPHITRVIGRDLAILHDLAALVERHVPDLSSLNPVGVVEEFSETLMKELDFTNEAVNAERFGQQFEGNPWIKVPEIHRDFSTPKILTMEFLAGISVEDGPGLAAAGIDPSELACNITRLIYEQIFDHGFFHADPHPGNLFIQRGGVTALLDYGMMGSFTPAFRSSIAHLIAGLADKNLPVVMRSILAMSEEGYSTDPTGMLSDVEAFADTHLNRPLRDINLGRVLNRLLELLRNNHLRMKGSFYLGIKALTQVEAIGRSLDPDLNFIEMGAPYAERLIREKYGPGRLFGLFRSLLGESLDFLEDFPGDFRNAYQRLKRGRINIPLEHKIDPKGFEPLRKTLDSIANRLANAILAASVLICSSIIVLADIPPHLGRVSIPGIVGIVFGAYMCLRLVLSIWRHGGL
jgi:ubiquinone biosynthesis protein